MNSANFSAMADALLDADNKCRKIVMVYPKHPSLQHSAYVLQEEFYEVMQEMKAKDGTWNYKHLYDELIDLVASAIRMIGDCPDLAKYAGPHPLLCKSEN